MKNSVIFITCVFVLTAMAASGQQPDAPASATYKLKPTPKTVAWGYYDASTPPVLFVTIRNFELSCFRYPA